MNPDFVVICVCIYPEEAVYRCMCVCVWLRYTSGDVCVYGTVTDGGCHNKKL